MTPDEVKEWLEVLNQTEGRKVSKDDVTAAVTALLSTVDRLREIAKAARTHQYNNRRLENAFTALQPGDVELKPRSA